MAVLTGGVVAGAFLAVLATCRETHASMAQNSSGVTPGPRRINTVAVRSISDKKKISFYFRS
jgi:hypothetical protein